MSLTAPISPQVSEPKLKLRTRLADPLYWSWAHGELRQYLNRREIPEIVAAIDEYKGSGVYRRIHALHDPRETTLLAEKVKALQPKVILEIGTCWGGSLFVWTRSNPQLELAISLDLPGGLYGGGYDDRRSKLYRAFVEDRPETRLKLVRCDSHQPSSRAEVEQLLGGRAIDFLFIDGDHSYDGVRQDFEMYTPLVRPGGLVAMHDINTKAADHHVWRYWREVKDRYRTEEIVADWSTNKYGLGLVWI
jgi:predicted O-methyltransferase YrrM